MSKELEALECIVVDLTPIAKEHNKDEIEQLKKSLEALDIIKKKQVNVFVLLHSGNLKIYNDIVEDNRKLTQEKYELLKEVLL